MNHFVLLICHEYNREIKKRKIRQFISKSAATFQGVKKQKNEHIVIYYWLM